MNKEKENKIVEIAEREVRKIVKEWEKNPYLWDTETDIHGELYVRIKKALKKYRVKGQYEAYMSKKAWFDIVYCKPLTYIKGGGKYYPDIVVYDDYTCDNGDRKINEPMLWVCEIKYKTQWGGDQSKENRDYDEYKLRRLLKQHTDSNIHGTKYAYFLNLERTKEKAIAHYNNRVNLKGKHK